MRAAAEKKRTTGRTRKSENRTFIGIRGKLM
jgi:hypothetical protein